MVDTGASREARRPGGQGPIAGAEPEKTARLLLQLAEEVTSSLDMAEVLERSFSCLRRMFDFDTGGTQLLDGDTLVTTATYPPLQPTVGTRIARTEGLGGRILETCDPLYVPDLSSIPGEVVASFPGARRSGSYFGAPLISGGSPIGVFHIGSPGTDAFSEDGRASFLALLPTISAAVQNALLFRQERDSVERLKAAERMQRDFVSLVSHELRTPLAAILGFSSAIVDGADRFPANTTRDLARRVVDAGHRLDRLINDLLDISRIERGVLHVEIEEVDSCSVVERVVGESQDVRQRIELDLGPGVPAVKADEGRLQQIVENLLGNARKYSPEGSTIKLGAGPIGDRVELYVEDEGRAIKPELRDQVFEPFFQIESGHARRAGIGIGLYLVRELCDLMAADIRLEPTNGNGNRFVVSLPQAG